jgi:hypothetical protein
MFGGKGTGTKPLKAEIHGMTAITGQTIAYAVVQVRPNYLSTPSYLCMLS